VTLPFCLWGLHPAAAERLSTAEASCLCPAPPTPTPRDRGMPHHITSPPWGGRPPVATAGPQRAGVQHSSPRGPPTDKGLWASSLAFVPRVPSPPPLGSATLALPCPWPFNCGNSLDPHPCPSSGCTPRCRQAGPSIPRCPSSGIPPSAHGRLWPPAPLSPTPLSPSPALLCPLGTRTATDAARCASAGLGGARVSSNAFQASMLLHARLLRPGRKRAVGERRKKSRLCNHTATQIRTVENGRTLWDSACAGPGKGGGRTSGRAALRAGGTGPDGSPGGPKPAARAQECDGRASFLHDALRLLASRGGGGYLPRLDAARRRVGGSR
jgi:hypothetical protein